MSLLNDIRFGARMLTKRPGLSSIAILALALGIGLTTTMFSIVYTAVLKGLPFEDSEELVQLFRTWPAQDARFLGVTIHDFGDWREQQTSFDDIAAFFAETVNVSGRYESVGTGDAGGCPTAARMRARTRFKFADSIAPSRL